MDEDKRNEAVAKALKKLSWTDDHDDKEAMTKIFNELWEDGYEVASDLAAEYAAGEDI